MTLLAEVAELLAVQYAMPRSITTGDVKFGIISLACVLVRQSQQARGT